MNHFVEMVAGELVRVINSCPNLGHIWRTEMRKNMDSLGNKKGGIIAKKDARTKGTRPTTNPGPVGYETRIPLGAKTPIGKRLSKLARR